jgi:hypothetical protein
MPWGKLSLISLDRRFMGTTATMVMVTKRKIPALDGNKITVYLQAATKYNKLFSLLFFS